MRVRVLLKKGEEETKRGLHFRPGTTANREWTFAQHIYLRTLYYYCKGIRRKYTPLTYGSCPCIVEFSYCIPINVVSLSGRFVTAVLVYLQNMKNRSQTLTGCGGCRGVKNEHTSPSSLISCPFTHRNITSIPLLIDLKLSNKCLACHSTWNQEDNSNHIPTNYRASDSHVYPLQTNVQDQRRTNIVFSHWWYRKT